MTDMMIIGYILWFLIGFVGSCWAWYDKYEEILVGDAIFFFFGSLLAGIIFLLIIWYEVKEIGYKKLF